MLFFEDKSRLESAENVGGKAWNLLRLERLQLLVPVWQVIGHEQLQSFFPEVDGATDISLIKSKIDQIEFPSTFKEEVEACFPNIETKLFSVRSSACAEDGAEHSFAGQFESHLYIQINDLEKYIKEVWKSVYSERVQAYAREKGVDHNLRIGVIVQEMIDPEASGVAFGANPTTGNREENVVCAVYGVGEGLVSGILNADTYTVKKGEISSELVEKCEALRAKPTGGTETTEVEHEKRNLPALSQSEILQLDKVLNLLESKLGVAQDIEFAVKDSKIYLLQTRPITTLDTNTEGQKIIWDNSNIVESYPGVTTPLTFSYILRGYRNVYLQLAQIMGASPKVLKANMHTFSNMLGLINGRVYYNLLSWYKVLAIFPGYSLNAQFMENMMGVKERFDLPKNQQLNKAVAYYRVGIMLIRILQNLRTIKKQTRLFLSEVDRVIAEFKAIDLAKLDTYELMELFRDTDAQLLKRWKAPLVNDSFAMIYFGMLQKTIEKHKLGDNPNLQNDLMVGNSDIISTQPVKRSIEIASVINQDEELRKLFVENKPKDIWAALQENERFDEVRTLIDAYINDFGDRCIGELKLETISYSSDPSILMHMIRGLVLQGVSNSSINTGKEQEIRTEAEKELKAALKGKPILRRRVSKLLKKARYFVSNRENLRYDRTRVFGITRAIFDEIGKRLEKAHVINNARDIYYLSIDEIFGFIEGTAHDVNLQALVDHRKIDFEKYRKMPAPAERIETYGWVNYGNNFYPADNTEQPEGALKGLGCCPGVVEARARVIHHPNEVEQLNGDILVTTSTDPGWVLLFPSASAIVVERGSLLSHSAIVSREMGIPCVVGVTGLLKRVKTGDLLRIDGRSGSVQIIESNE
ncbi:PEP/pyruvate-binding domain-containing protein [Owenweeksia hongkongensis]|uniref:PEP/pyruvate-binding domain-containing protein n=1 Tax=Owenweeksia hongkongensis TaxID=253245 RepID=UPI003A8E88DD